MRMKDREQLFPALSHLTHGLDLLPGFHLEPAVGRRGRIRDRVAVAWNATFRSDQAADFDIRKSLGIAQQLVNQGPRDMDFFIVHGSIL